MPLSKARNRERMRKVRLHALLLPPQKPKAVQLVSIIPSWKEREDRMPELDADGNAIPEY